MSITFAAQQLVTNWVIECACGDVTAVAAYPTHAEAYEAAHVLGVQPLCGDEYCAAYGPSVTTGYVEADDYVINVSEANARYVLDNLGLLGATGELWGAASGETLLGTVLLGQAIIPSDEGRPSSQSGRVIDCGRRPGYLGDVLGRLAELAQFAKAHDLQVTWA